mmetsp:Transcript_74625/g.218762  ORF Transcript_74625/g.218762 Transcript_74625/m.218762 type:complete len:604 (-) Transcript_74625:295-2106(-)
MGQSASACPYSDKEESSQITRCEVVIPGSRTSPSWDLSGLGDLGDLHCCRNEAADAQESSVQVVTDLALRRAGDERLLFQLERRPLRREGLLVERTRRRFEDVYEPGRKLGAGTFGDVHEAAPLPEGRVPGAADAGGSAQPKAARTVAVKVFHVAKAEGEASAHDPKTTATKQASLDNERTMLATLEHPHIVRMHEWFQEEGESLRVVMELCRGGELFDRLVSAGRERGQGGLGEAQAQRLYGQMLRAVNYLHLCRVVHRDLKTENFLLLGGPGSREWDTVKLCDFGTAVKLSDAAPRCMELRGTLSYTAPEVYFHKGAGLAADLWSMGIVLYVLLTGSNPFHTSKETISRDETIKRIKKGYLNRLCTAWRRASPESRDLVERFLVLNEAQRLTCAQAVHHKWLASGRSIASRLRTLSPFSHRDLVAFMPELVALLLRLPHLAEEQCWALTACAMALSDAELSSIGVWRSLFLVLDTDDDGRLGFAELLQGLKFFGGEALSELVCVQLEVAIHALDFDQSGSIEWVEWLSLALLGERGLLRADEPARTAFRLLDQPQTPSANDHQTEVEMGSSRSTASTGCTVARSFSELLAVLASVEAPGGA